MSLTIAAVTVDSQDVAALADFWSALLERPVDPDASADFASIGLGGSSGPALCFAAVPDKNPGRNVVHLDLAAQDWTAQVDRAIDLGAKRVADFDEGGFQCTTLADPEGNLFDIAKAE
jgi:hypothetical protein